MCRAQYAQSNRQAEVPCDSGPCKFKISPGDIGPEGCGLSPENEFAVWFYPRWKLFKDKAFDLITVEEPDKELFVEKLMLLEQYTPIIEERSQRRAEKRSIRKNGKSSRGNRR